jgi:hypothetical protein
VFSGSLTNCGVVILLIEPTIYYFGVDLDGLLSTDLKVGYLFGW